MNFDHGNIVHKTQDQINGVDIIEIDSDYDSDSDFEEASDYNPRIVKR